MWDIGDFCHETEVSSHSLRSGLISSEPAGARFPALEHATATSCSAPVIWLATVLAVACLVFCVLAAMAGVAAGGFERRILAVVVLTLVSAGLTGVIFLTVPVVQILLTPR